MIQRGDLAVDNDGNLGVVTCDEPQNCTIGSTSRFGWCGVAMVGKIGEPWFCYKPKVIGHILLPSAHSIISKFIEDRRWATYPGNLSEVISHRPGPTKITAKERERTYQCDEGGQWQDITHAARLE